MQYFSEDDPIRKLKQAEIYRHKGMEEEACKLYEQLLFSGYQILNQVLNVFYLFSMEKKDYVKAKMYLDKLSEMARTFEMGRYQEVSGYLDFAVSQKNVGETIQILREMLSNIETIEDYAKTFLFEHLDFRQLEQSFYNKIKKNILQGLKNDESLAYMKGCDEWERMIEELETETTV